MPVMALARSFRPGSCPDRRSGCFGLLGKVRIVRGLGAIVCSSGTQTYVFQKVHDALAVLRGSVLSGCKMFAADLVDGLPRLARRQVGLDALLKGQGHRQLAGEILRQAHDLVWEAGDVLLAHVGQQQVNLMIVARLCRQAFIGARDAVSAQRLLGRCGSQLFLFFYCFPSC
jgi:hypothetical protein